MSQFYLGNPNLKAPGVQIEWTPEKLREYQKCMIDPLHFIRQHMWIVHLDHGLVKFDLYDYQEGLINTFLDQRRIIVLSSRQSGKSITTIGFFLHYILFNTHKTIAILANKGDSARGLLARLKLAYEKLPEYLQQGVVEWNKGSIELENGCKILAGSTSNSAVRSQSINILFLDEFAFVEPNMADDFFKSTYPTISSGTTTKIIVVSCVTGDTMVVTPDGIQTVSDFTQDTAIRKAYHVPEYSVIGKDGISHSGSIMANSGKVPTKIITTTSSQNECSLVHQWWACKGGEYGWYQSQDLDIGDYVSIQYGMDMWGTDDSLSPEYSNKNTNIFWPDQITPDLAYLFGLYISEGYIRNIQNGRGYQMIITCGDDISHVFDNLNIKYSCPDGLHYIVNSKSLGELFESVGFDISLKAPQKIIPKKLLKMSRENIVAMMQGIFDGDGYSRNDRGYIGIGLSSKDLIKQIRMVLLNFGILTDYQECLNEGTDLVESESMQYRISANGRFSKIFYDEVGFRFERKQFKQHALKHGTRTGACDVIPFSRQRIEALPKYKRKGIFNGVSKNNIHWSRDRLIELSDIDDQDFQQFISDNVSPNIKWEQIKSIKDSENEVCDFSLDDIPDDKWCHSVVYNGMIGHQTANGMNHYFRMWDNAVREISNFVPIRIDWFQVPGRDEAWKEETINATSQEQFDQEFGNEFLGSAGTLFTPITIKNLVWKEPVQEKDDFKIFYEPESKHKYVITVDTSEGVGLDYHAFSVTDITEMPYQQVATFRSNTTDVHLYPDVIYKTANYYNEAYVLVELNEQGGMVADILWDDLEYENLMFVTKSGRKGQVLGGGFGGNTQIGVKQSKTTKKVGCTVLKTLVENNQYIINDFETIAESSRFVRRLNSYQAEEPYNDDMMMTLVMFGWITKQQYFKDEMQQDIRSKIADDHIDHILNMLTPVGTFVDGTEHHTENEYYNGMVWRQ